MSCDETTHDSMREKISPYHAPEPTVRDGSVWKWSPTSLDFAKGVQTILDFILFVHFLPAQKAITTLNSYKKLLWSTYKQDSL